MRALPEEVTPQMAAEADPHARVIELSQPLRRPQPRVSTKPIMLMCTECGQLSMEVKRRFCTGGHALCPTCRYSPEHKVLSHSYLQKSVPWLEPLFYPEIVGHTVNCKHPAFRPQRMYKWSDVAARCLELGLKIPD